MKTEPLSPAQVLEALERFGPQARPYNFDDHFDCWGLAQRVFDWLDDGYDLNLEALDETTAGNWRPIGERDELVPGDLLATHPQPDPEYHVVFYCGRVGDVDLVYDSSPRGAVPLFDERLRMVGERRIHTRYSRATETTERLRDDGGAYLRLWHGKMRYYHAGLHERLVAGGAAEERDLVALRRAAGLSDLPFYCRRRLPLDAAGRELYDNLLTRHLDYYVPDGAPVPDDRYDEVLGARSGARAGLRLPRGPAASAGPAAAAGARDHGRPGVGRGPGAARGLLELLRRSAGHARPRLPHRGVGGDARHLAPPAPARRLRRAGHRRSRSPKTCFTRTAASRSSCTRAGTRDTRPARWRRSSTVRRAATRCSRTTPSGRAACGRTGVARCRPGRTCCSSGASRGPASDQVSVDISVFEGGTCLREDAEPVFECGVQDAAAGCRCVVPAAVLGPGRDYYWYVTPRDAAGRVACAPAEAVFVVAGRG